MKIAAMKLLGHEWVSPTGMHRIYFKQLNELIGLKFVYNKLGKVRGAELRGKHLPVRLAREIDCTGSLFFYDVIHHIYNWPDVPLAAVPLLQDIFDTRSVGR